MKTCTLANCSRPIHGRGLCRLHYRHWLRANPGVKRGPNGEPMDASPILAALDRAGVAPQTKANERAIRRAKKSGQLAPHVVDRLAVTLLGVHPAAIYGDDWWLPEDEEVAA